MNKGTSYCLVTFNYQEAIDEIKNLPENQYILSVLEEGPHEPMIKYFLNVIDKCAKTPEIDHPAGILLKKCQDLVLEVQEMWNDPKVIWKSKANTPADFHWEGKTPQEIAQWFQTLKEKHVTWPAVNDYLKEIGYPKGQKYTVGKSRGDWIIQFVKRNLKQKD